MSCILRVGGANLSLGELLQVELTPDSTWEKGAPKLSTRVTGPVSKTSGARYVVSDADFDEFEEQKSDAVAFLGEYQMEIREIVGLAGVDGADLDFGVYRKDVLAQSENFPPELVRLAGGLGLGLEISLYEPCEDDKRDGSEPD